MTGADWLTYVKDAFKRTDKDDEIYASTYDAIQFLVQKYPFEDYKVANYEFSLTGPTSSVAIPTNMLYDNGRITCQESSDTWPLEKINRDRFTAVYGQDNADDDGVPKAYNIYGGTIYIGPVLDSQTYTFQLDYSLNYNTEVTAITTVVPFTQINRNMLRQFVLYFLYLDLDEPEMASEKLQIATALLDQITENEDKLVEGVTTINYRDI